MWHLCYRYGWYVTCCHRKSLEWPGVSCVHAVHGATHTAVYKRPQHLQQVQRERVQCCPTCTAEFSTIRNVALQHIVRRQKYPCANRQSGCLQLLSIEHIAEHNSVCVYRKIKCPFTLNNTCTWNGFKSDLKEHAKAAHPGRFFESPSIRALYVDGIVSLLSYFGELFVRYQRIWDGRLYCAIQLTGTSSEAAEYKCEFALRAANDIEQISNTFLVQGHSEEFEKIFNSGKCFCQDETVARHVLVGNDLNLIIKLSTV